MEESDVFKIKDDDEDKLKNLYLVSYVRPAAQILIILHPEFLFLSRATQDDR